MGRMGPPDTYDGTDREKLKRKLNAHGLGKAGPGAYGPGHMKEDTGSPPDGSAATSLRSDCAFVVQFTAERRERGFVSGRVEHLTSGRAIRFDSWARFREFVEDRLRDATEQAPE